MSRFGAGPPNPEPVQDLTAGAAEHDPPARRMLAQQPGMHGNLLAAKRGHRQRPGSPGP